MSKKISRRQAISRMSAGGALAALYALPQPLFARPAQGKIVVAGAGAFGGWTALWLLRKGYDVTLIDPFGPGNNQSSSGGETRLIRAFYDQQIYFDLTLRAVELWKEFDKLTGQPVFHQNGLLVFNYKTTTPESEAASAFYRKAGMTLEKLTPAEAAKRWPQLRTDDLNHVLHDPKAGYLEARQGCIAVCRQFIREGGTYIQQKVTGETMQNGKAQNLILADGRRVEGDQFVMACGPWLVRLFPALTSKISIVRGLCFFFSPPANDADWMENRMPTWMDRDFDGPFRPFGVPGSAFRGFKVGLTPPDNNVITDRFDTYDRHATTAEIEWARKVLARRFPGLARQPLIEHRVCQYSNTPDSDFIIDRHPEASNLWLLGGDSGHGYKLGPSLGEWVADTVTGKKEVLPMFSLKRFS